jgi:N-glycosylase/DNA lyase
MWPISFWKALEEAPQAAVIAVVAVVGAGKKKELVTRQQHWSLFLRSVRERPGHGLYRQLKEWQPRTQIDKNGVLRVFWKKRKTAQWGEEKVLEELEKALEKRVDSKA